MARTLVKTPLKAQVYNQILSLIEKGFYEEASQRLREIRKGMQLPSSNTEDNTLHVFSILLSSRIAMKGGLLPDHIHHIQTQSIKDDFLRGEINFVKGLYYFNQSKMKEGAECFLEAYKNFKASTKPERMGLARYNYIIGKSYEPNIDPHWLFTELRELESEIQGEKNHKLHGVILRQKSYLYKEQGRYQAAKTEALASISLLEIHGAHSDYHLALLNLVDISLELKDQTAAEEALERVMPPFDPRVAFPLSYFQHRLKITPLDFSIQKFSCPHFLMRYKDWQSSQPLQAMMPTPVKTSLRSNESELPQVQSNLESTESSLTHWKWNSSMGVLHSTSQTFSFKKHSMEKKLVDNIFAEPISKELLSERLWPGFSEVKLLDNRLHRLISRVNKKIGGHIQLQAGKYFLTLP